MNLTFLFWNLNRKPLAHLIGQVAEELEIDVLIFAESKIAPVTLLATLNAKKATYYYTPSECERIEVYSRFDQPLIRPIFEDDKTTIRHLQVPNLPDLILVATHGPSKLYWNEDDQSQRCFILSRQIREVEKELAHTRTILVGDLNMDPFEKGIVGSSGLHAVMSQDIARRLARTVDGVSYPFFYNPMWSLFGDLSNGPPGTYFYNRSGRPINYFFHLFDQVMLRPSLLDYFKDDQLQIITSINEVSLVKGSVPNQKNASDHLPLCFTFGF